MGVTVFSELGKKGQNSGEMLALWNSEKRTTTPGDFGFEICSDWGGTGVEQYKGERKVKKTWG